MSEIVVLTDGQCRFCKATLAWVEKKLEVKAIAFQDADLSSFGLNYTQCSEALHVVHSGKVYVGADSIAFLLSKRGNRFIAFIIKASGPLGRYGYKWVASHRNTWLIKLATRVIERSL